MLYHTDRFVTLIIALVLGVVCLLIFYIDGYAPIQVLLYSVGLSFVFYLVVYSLLHQMITDRVRTIYKMILRTKASKDEKLFLEEVLPKKSLQQVEKEVSEWAENETKELLFYKKLSQFKKEFLQNMSHELRTPLFSIQAYSENLQHLLQKQSVKPPALDFIAVILRNTERLNKLIGDIQTISDLESERIVLAQSTFILEELISEVLQELHFLIQAKDTKIDQNFTQQAHSVYADKGKIKQVLTNIIVNAIEYNPAHTTLKCTVLPIDKENLALEITDSGKGIEERHLERIFERFYRIDDNRSRTLGGSGLGLAICKHIMQLHHSFIHVRSKVGIGTTFTIGLTRFASASSFKK